MQVLEQREALVNSASNEIFEEYENIDPEVNNKIETLEHEQSYEVSHDTAEPNFPGVSQVLYNLYLCGASVLSPKVIAQLGIDFVINVASELPDTPLPSATRILYLRINISDRPNAELSKHFDEVADMIEQVRRNGGKTLVHCVAGVSRSASLCLAYLVKYAGMNLKDAFMHVKNIRPQIRPNSGFFQQLRTFEEARLGTQSVKMLYFECLQREVPDVYESEYRPMEDFYQRQRQSSKRKLEKAALTS